MGATSGLGRACAEDFISRGYVVGVCGRRTEELEQIRAIAPERVYTATIDVTSPDADKQLAELIERMGGMDIYFHVSGNNIRFGLMALKNVGKQFAVNIVEVFNQGAMTTRAEKERTIRIAEGRIVGIRSHSVGA